MSEAAKPSWMSAEEWTAKVAAYRTQGRSEDDIRELAAYLQRRGPRQPRQRRSIPVGRGPDGSVRGGGKGGAVDRSDFVAAADEPRHFQRDQAGAPLLRLVEAGDRLAVWSPLDGGALINPKSAALRAFGLIQSICRGGSHYAPAYRAADLRMGRTVHLRREPDNPYDKNAVALHAPNARNLFGYVQRGHAGAVARRIDSGEVLGAVCMWGPGPRRDDNTTRLLIASAFDLSVMAPNWQP